MYEHFGKVREIDGHKEINDIYEQSRAAVLPEVCWMTGPIGSGKSIIGQNLCDIANMDLVNYTQWLAGNPTLGKKDEELQTQAFIKHLSYSSSARVLIEDFPQSEF